MAYVTASQLKQHLGIDASDTSQDAYLGELADQVSGFIDSYTGRTFSASDRTATNETHTRSGRVIWLRSSGVKDVTEVKVRELRSDDWTTLGSAEYEWTESGRLELAYPYTFVSVTYTVAGAPLSAAITGAALELAANVYRGGGEQGAIKSERNGDLAVTYADVQSGASSGVLAVLNTYRMPNI